MLEQVCVHTGEPSCGPPSSPLVVQGCSAQFSTGEGAQAVHGTQF